MGLETAADRLKLWYRTKPHVLHSALTAGHTHPAVLAELALEDPTEVTRQGRSVLSRVLELAAGRDGEEMFEVQRARHILGRHGGPVRGWHCPEPEEAAPARVEPGSSLSEGEELPTPSPLDSLVCTDGGPPSLVHHLGSGAAPGGLAAALSASSGEERPEEWNGLGPSDEGTPLTSAASLAGDSEAGTRDGREEEGPEGQQTGPRLPLPLRRTQRRPAGKRPPRPASAPRLATLPETEHLTFETDRVATLEQLREGGTPSASVDVTPSSAAESPSHHMESGKLPTLTELYRLQLREMQKSESSGAADRWKPAAWVQPGGPQ